MTEKIIFTLHAIERMKQRRISIEEIRNCLKFPDKMIIEHGICKCIRKVDNKVIIVVFRKEDNKIIVITTYKSSRVAKYLK